MLCFILSWIKRIRDRLHKRLMPFYIVLVSNVAQLTGEVFDSYFIIIKSNGGTKGEKVRKKWKEMISVSLWWVKANSVVALSLFWLVESLQFCSIVVRYILRQLQMSSILYTFCVFHWLNQTFVSQRYKNSVKTTRKAIFELLSCMWKCCQWFQAGWWENKGLVLGSGCL